VSNSSKIRVLWDATRGVGLVMNPVESGPPYLGTVRRQDLLDGWTASSSMYTWPEELGVFGSEEEAIEGVLNEAVRVQERRAESARVAAQKQVECERIRGTGRKTIEPDGWLRAIRALSFRRDRSSILAPMPEATP